MVSNYLLKITCVPMVPARVSYPPLKEVMNPWAFASLAAAWISGGRSGPPQDHPPTCLTDVLLRRTVGNVLPDGGVEEEGVLVDHGNVPVEGG